MKTAAKLSCVASGRLLFRSILKNQAKQRVNYCVNLEFQGNHNSSIKGALRGFQEDISDLH